ncbi:hypothetical protein GCM10009775_29490 [Microbacterium aoyamense]|uniref:ThuA-like domain-containing protein n=1 Tax=Microbacterium aoyamense TaxID=344166 RepID=A0ABN2PW28_9MICO|nr:ThuA domain-containing protein [Microbacterium aoyamense]
MTTTLTRDGAREGAALEATRATIVVGGDDVYEDLFGVADATAQLLAEVGIAATIRVGTTAFLAAPAPDLFVLDTALPELTDERVDALVAAVRAGSGLLVLHASAVAPEGSAGDRLAVLVGARFASHGPTPHESRFFVELDDAHPITVGIHDFDVDHEHYALEVAPGSRAIAWRRSATGREPVVLVREDGAGRVCYVQLGHDTRPLGEPPVRALLARAAAWLTHHEKEV